jgi:hypothetical protein
MTRRNPISGLLLLGFGLMLGAVLFGAGGTTPTWVAAPLIVLGFGLKLMLFMLILGFMARAIGRTTHRSSRRSEHRSGPPWMRHDFRGPWNENDAPTDQEATPSPADHFHEWHRMAHAREEVDDYAPPVED